MFWIFKKNLSQEDLSNIAKNKHKKEWEKRLKIIQKEVKQSAKNGAFEYTVTDQLLRCDHNMTRTWEEITNDFKKKFPNCECILFRPAVIIGQGNTFCKIIWKKKV